jgi:hypothetical protein
MTAANRRTQSRSHTNLIARRIESKGREAAPPPPREPSDARAEARLERVHIGASLSRTRRVINVALALGCEHAIAGRYCFASTKGLCRERYERARAEVDAATPQPLIVAPRSPAAVVRELDFRHPNRQWGGTR